jgi:tRNA pseudouridine55 synthase
MTNLEKKSLTLEAYRVDGKKVEDPPQGFLVMDKQGDWTSHDVVAKMRGVLGVKKIGHLGTLDPLATGVLVLAIGRSATKRVQEFMKLPKTYLVEMELGKFSDTYDSEGKVQIMEGNLLWSEGKATGVLEEAEQKIYTELETFWGKSMQVPPAFSAKKIGGRKAYDLARAGIEVKLAACAVEMQGSDIRIDWSGDFPKVFLKLEVTSGTYVRSFIHDLGQQLGCGGIMTGLRRTHVGPFLLEDAVTIDQVQAGEEFGLLCTQA